MTLSEKTKRNLQSTAIISGDLTIAAGESIAMQRIVNVMSNIVQDYPTVKLHIAEKRLNTGTVDFAVIIGNLPLNGYASMQLPEKDTWSVLVASDDPLAKKEHITPNDIVNRQIINSQQAETYGIFDNWFGNYKEQVNIIGTYNLSYNGTLLVKNHAAIMLTLDKLANTSADSGLVFIPLKPAIYQPLNIIWKKETTLSPVAQLFLDRLKASIMDDVKFD